MSSQGKQYEFKSVHYGYITARDLNPVRVPV